MATNRNIKENLSVVVDGKPAKAATAAAITEVEPALDFSDLDSPELYLNRELTWLEFNRRVLHEAQDESNPLLERLKFVGIVSSNLDEFFMKRIGGLKQQVGAGVLDYSVDGRLPAQQIEECYVEVRELEAEKSELVPRLIAQLAEHDIHITPYEALGDEDQETIRSYYFDNIYPLVTPQGVDSAHPFPFISNLSLNLLVTLRHSDSEDELRARVKVPVGLGIPRFLQVPNTHIFVPLESVMAKNLDVLFPNMEIVASETFYVTRNANAARDEDEADDLLAIIESEVRHRRFAKIVRVVVQHDMDETRRGMLAAELGLDEADVFEKKGLLATRDLLSLVNLEIPALRDPPHHPIDHPKLAHMPNIFHAVRDHGSILLHHPYESFSTSVERLLREASRDPKVRAIKMTLYRTSGDTKVIDYLVDAAQNGKQVAVVVELKARFDEAANIRWSSRLEEAGIHVTYGVMELKTHCKVILVVRNDYSGLRRYVHIGTGNYHAGNARLYTDLGLLTMDPDIGRDITELFNYLTTGFTPKRNYRKILPAPKLLKRALLDKIQREIDHQAEGSDGHVQIKINALEDKDIVRALYEASQAGVKVDLIVRDTCRLRPGIPGLSENIRVFSVVGRFLEHSRIYYFENAGNPEYYIGSADAMMRNLEHRVEVVAPVEDPELQARLRHLIDTQLSDEFSIWQMHSDGSYVQLKGSNEAGEGSQQALIRDAEDRVREANRLKRRKPKGLRHRNIHLRSS
ncbi:MAG: polyphosphate kinase 1 [Gammaproteobacteria bacterium]|jgi:polyphosphate kinase|nr:polyphosphate kinase 1 [Gammaproteobacteria bacterium]